MGEHAAVYGAPAIVAATGPRLSVRAGRSEHARPDEVELVLRASGHREMLPWAGLRAYAAAVRGRWSRFAACPDQDRLRVVRMNGGPAFLVRVALGEIALRRGLPHGEPLLLEVAGDLPAGRGLGSSAALSVSVLAAVLAWSGENPDADEIEELAYEVERRQHGRPSGVDGAAVLHGGLVWACARAAPPSRITPLPVRPHHLDRIRVYDTGRPAQSTGEVIAAVRDRLCADGADLLERMASTTRRMRRALEEEGRGDPPAPLIRRYHALLCELGVVPRAVQHLVERIEEEGGAAKISGAGALDDGDASGAGMLLVHHPEPERLDALPGLSALRRIPVNLGARGLELSWPT